jgi:Retroviral aspartyl protease
VPFVVSVRVNKCGGTAVIDSGSGVSLINQTYYAQFSQGLEGKIPEVRESVSLTGANGQEIRTNCVARVQFQLGTKKFQHWFIVAEDIPYEIIIGNDFLAGVGGTLRIREEQLVIPGMPPIRGSCRPNESVFLRVHEKTSVPPNCRMFVPVNTGPMTWRDESTRDYMIQPLDNDQDAEYLVEKQLHSIRPGTWLKIAIMNPNSHELMLYSGDMIARMTPLEGHHNVNTVFATRTPKVPSGTQRTREKFWWKPDQVRKITREHMYLVEKGIMMQLPIIKVEELVAEHAGKTRITWRAKEGGQWYELDLPTSEYRRAVQATEEDARVGLTTARVNVVEIVGQSTPEQIHREALKERGLTEVPSGLEKFDVETADLTPEQKDRLRNLLDTNRELWDRPKSYGNVDLTHAVRLRDERA